MMVEHSSTKLDADYLQGVLLTSAVISLPSISGGFAWLYFMSPLPVIYFLTVLAYDKGFKIITHAAIISGVIALIFKALPLLLFSLTLIPVGIILARGLSINEKVHRSALTAAVTLGAIWLATGFIIGTAHHTNLYTEILKNIDAGLIAAFEAYKETPNLPIEAQANLQDAFTRVRELVPRIFPGIIAISTIFSIWSNMMIANFLIKKKGMPGWGNFKDWRLPEQLIWLVILSGFLVFMPGGLINTLGINFLLILGSIYFLQGLSVISTIFSKWMVPKPVKFFIIFILILQAYGFIILALLGVADIWADFGKPKQEDKQT